ncbi:MAG: cobalamin-binding protein [Methanobacteriota archaeon]|nr:MAG: cobalamin-binding protein [Euryarchaeota archaeon]
MEIKEEVIKGGMEAIRPLIEEGLKKGRTAEDILAEMIEGMHEVGELFERKEYYVPETLLSAHTMMLGLEMLRPLLSVEKAAERGRVIVGAVESDIHDIGLNLVAMFLEAAGFEIYNLGRDVPTKVFLEKAEELDPDVVGVSAMMSTTALKVREVIEGFEKAGLRDGRFFVVGGAAFSEELADEIGADAYAQDAKKAVEVFQELMKRRK